MYRQENPGIPMTISEEQDMAQRWDQLKQAGPSTNVQRTNPAMGNKAERVQREIKPQFRISLILMDQCTYRNLMSRVNC